jgi:hypothetical protein
LQLALSRTESDVTLNWPFGVPVVQLFETTDLTPPAAWSPVGGVPVFSDGRWVQTLSTGTNNQRFFILLPP